MQNINLLFEGDINDVDIVCVPCEIADDIEHVVSLYFVWMHNNINKHNYWVMEKSGEKILCYETESFVWWINNHYIQSECAQQAYIVLQHTQFDATYPTVEF